MLSIEPLEDRFQPSGTAGDAPDLMPVTPAILGPAVKLATPASGIELSHPGAAVAAVPARRELVLLDRDLPDRETLIRDLTASRPVGTSLEVVELNGGGVAEITAILHNYRGLDAIHVLSHGEAGVLHLGSDQVDTATLGRFATEIGTWGGSLNPGGDLLLYGCNLAGNAAGQALVEQLAGLTGADTAASTDLTGSAAIGGDWNLEYHTGAIQAAVLADPNWAHVLAAPTGILLFTNGNVSNSGTPGIQSWTAGTVLDVTDPNFALEPGTTNGTFSALFNLNSFTSADVKIDALHYVRHTVTVGTGAASLTLLPGDLLLSIDKDNETLTSLNSLTVSKDDVFVFRPSAGGNYSSGTFIPLLDNFKSITGGTDTLGISLVEQNTVVGDVTLQAGTFLFVRDGGSQDDDIRLFTPTGVGAGTTAGAVSVLIDGADLNIGPQLNGIDLVETSATVGGRPLAAGTLLIAIDGGSVNNGQNQLTPTRQDIVALDVSKTTLGSGKAVATASLLFQGADVGLSGGSEVIRGFSLTSLSSPVAGADAYTANEDTPLTVNAASGVLANDTSPTGGTLTASLASNPTHGTVALNSDGSFTYTPGANYFGSDSFTYTVSDSNGGTATGTVTITVNAVNDAPSFSLAGNPPTVDEDSGPQTVTGFVTGISPGPANESGQNLTFLVTGNTNPGLFASGPAVAADGTLTYTPAANASGTATITLVLRDNGGTANGGQDTSTTRQFTITVRAVNDAPTLDPISDVTVPEDSGPQAISLTGVSAGGGENQTLAITAISSNPSIIPNPTITYTSPNATGTLTFTSNPNANGTATITVTVRDAGLNGFLGDADDGITTRSFTVTVTPVPDPPIANPDTYSTSSGTQLTIAGPGVLDNDSDPDGDSITAAPVSGPANGTLVLAADGSFSYTPNAGFSGVDSFTYQAVDSTGRTSPATAVTINVALGNRSPSATNDAFTTAEDTTLTGSVLGNDSDPDGDPLSVSVAGSPANGTLVLNSDGTFTYTPNANFNGSDSFTYTLSDGKGGTANATVTLTVTPVNDPPTAVNDSGTVAEDGSVTIDVRANDTDPENDVLTVVAVTQAANGMVTTDGLTVTYTPNPTFNGSDSFTYTISDGNGGIATATVSVTVSPVNDPPTLDPIPDVTLPEDSGSQTVSLTGISAGGGESQTLTITATSSNPAVIPDPTVNYTSPNATGTLIFASVPNANGTATITVTVDDGITTTTRTFNITVTAVNDPPTITPIAGQTILVNGTIGPLAFTVGDVETPASALTVTATSDNPALIPGANIAITATGGGGQQITLTPTPDNSGVAVITVTVSDGTASTATTFTVIVAPPNRAPTAAGDSYTTTPGTTLAVPAFGTLVNDVDPDGDILNAVLVTGPLHGTLQLNPDGSFVYDPAPGFAGMDTFTYQAVDPSGATSGTATVTIQVLAPNAPPPAQPNPIPAAPAPSPPSDPTPRQPTPPQPTPLLAPRSETADSGGGAVTVPTDVSARSEEASTNTGDTGGGARNTASSPVYFAISGSAGAPEALPPGDGKAAQGEPAASVPKPPPPEVQATVPPRTTPAVAPVSAPVLAPVALAPTPPPEAPDPQTAADAVEPGLDKVARDIGADAEERTVTDAVVATTVVATAGYVLLNTRAVYWFISALLARPAVWRRFDPIDVIYSWEQEQDLGRRPDAASPEDDESLQSMVG